MPARPDRRTRTACPGLVRWATTGLALVTVLTAGCSSATDAGPSSSTSRASTATSGPDPTSSTSSSSHTGSTSRRATTTTSAAAAPDRSQLLARADLTGVTGLPDDLITGEDPSADEGLNSTSDQTPCGEKVTPLDIPASSGAVVVFESPSSARLTVGEGIATVADPELAARYLETVASQTRVGCTITTKAGSVRGTSTVIEVVELDVDADAAFGVTIEVTIDGTTAYVTTASVLKGTTWITVAAGNTTSMSKAVAAIVPLAIAKL